MKSTYPSIAALAKDSGIDKRVIKAASAKGLPGFNVNRSINWVLLEPEYNKHKDELEKIAFDKKSIEQLKIEEKELGNDLKRLEIKKKQGQYIDPDEWYDFHVQFGSKLSTIINTTRKHLMANCIGYESVIDAEMLSIFNLINKEIEKCKQK